MNCPHHPNRPGLVYCPKCRAAEEEEEARRSGTTFLPSAAHNTAWETYFIKPMIRIMKEKGIREIHITINEGKAAYVIDPVKEENA